MVPVEQIGGAVVHEVGALGGDLRDDLEYKHHLQHVVPRRSSSFSREEKDEKDDGDGDSEEISDELFDLAGHCLFASVAVYFLADMRAMIRQAPETVQGSEELKQKILDLPISDVQVAELLHANPKLVETMKAADDRAFGLYMTALQMYARELQWEVDFLDDEDAAELGAAAAGVEGGRPDRRRQSTVLCSAESQGEAVIVDDKQKDELVYSITVYRARRILMVAFRGSVTIHDWAVDARLTITRVANPLAGEGSVTIPQRKDLGIHSGFHSYLFGTRTKRDSNSKYDQILENLRVLLKKHPGFNVFVTGHSLGGALATLCSFRLAMEEDIQKPVTCVTFASPLIGNVAFARAFQELEIQHKIVCLRVANHGDVVTQLPDRLTCLTCCCQDNIFRHVGIEMRLFDESSETTHKFRHKRIIRSRIRQLYRDVQRSFWHSTLYTIRIPFGTCKDDLIAYHGCLEYLKRLKRAQESSQSLSMQAIFGDYHRDVSTPSASFRPITGEESG